MSTSSGQPAIVFGKSEEWEDFHRRHPRFAERLPHLKATLEAAFAPVSTPKLVDRILRNLLRTCVEDFFEILLLAGNGYGIGAQKLLRPMYERAVTAWYLAQNPRKARDFLNFGKINMFKLIDPIERTHGRKDLIPPKILSGIKAFHGQFGKKKVKTATGKERKRSTARWSDDLSVEVMAEKAGPLGKMVVCGWHLPTFQIHASLQNILARVEQTPQGGISFNDGPQRKIADEQLTWAHLVLLSVLELQVRHFRRVRSLKKVLEEVGHDFKDIWHEHCLAPSA
jgi:hypothetical protein